MKKMFLSFFLLGSLLLVSCSGNSPKEVAEKFMKALRAGDIKEAQKYCDEPTAKMLTPLQELFKLVPEEERKEKVKVITVTRVEINGDTAKAFCKEEGSETEQPLDLKKIDGKWVVSVKKEQGKEGLPGMSAEPKQDSEVVAPAEETETPTEAPAEAPAEPAEAK